MKKQHSHSVNLAGKFILRGVDVHSTNNGIKGFGLVWFWKLGLSTSLRVQPMTPGWVHYPQHKEGCDGAVIKTHRGVTRHRSQWCHLIAMFTIIKENGNWSQLNLQLISNCLHLLLTASKLNEIWKERTSLEADITNMTEADGPDQVIYHIQKKQNRSFCEKQKDSSNL